MKTAVTIGGFALGLLAVFGAAFGVGAVLAPAALPRSRRRCRRITVP